MEIKSNHRSSWAKERSISPADVRHGRFKGALGDCFQTGIRPSQELLHPSESGSTKSTPVIRFCYFIKSYKTVITLL